MSFEAFIAKKLQNDSGQGFEPLWMPEFLFDFQRELVGFNLRHGRSATFADCGMGKTPMHLTWAENVRRHTGKRVLVVTPLAVARQTEREAAKFGIDASREKSRGIVITNYERLHHYSPDDYGGVVCDESSAIKAFDGKRRAAVTEFLRTIPFRLLCTATAAPNDYTELGTSSEALGYLGHVDMLTRFFTNKEKTIDSRGRWKGFAAPRAFEQPQWRFKGHAQEPFWRWVCSWARACRKPSDLGFDDSRFVLPALTEREHLVEGPIPDGCLWSVPAKGMREERVERRNTIKERCERAAELADHSEPVVLWCHLNDEGDLLEKLIPGARQIAGKTKDEEKEELFEAFSSGELRALIIKPKIGAWGLNWQHCRRIVTFASHSYEQYYQAVRRCWRFGQEREVMVDVIASAGESGVMRNLQRKAVAADEMFAALVRNMHDSLSVNRGRVFGREMEVPPWMRSNTPT